MVVTRSVCVSLEEVGEAPAILAKRLVRPENLAGVLVLAPGADRAHTMSMSAEGVAGDVVKSEKTMASERWIRTETLLRLAVAGGMGVTLAGCLQTAPVVVTPQEQASRIVYSCPGGRMFDVTRIRDQGSVILVVDGNTLQLNRDASYTAAERYTNRIQTLTLFGNSATYDSIGRASYGPCTIGSVTGGPGDGRDGTPTGREQRQSRD